MPTTDDSALELAQLFGEIARGLAMHEETQVVLDRIVQLAVETLDHCDHAGISLVEGRRITSPASTSEASRVVDAMQSEVDEGPCIDAIKEQQLFTTGNLLAEARWPAFASRAHAETGILSIASLRLFVEEDTMGSLNLYSREPDAFTDEDVAAGAVFAAHAAVALSAARREHNLRAMASSRDLIGQAKGMLMAQSGIDEDTAFDLLRRASQRLNIKLVEVAKQVTHPPADPTTN